MLSKKQLECIRLMVSTDMKQIDIAKAVGVHESTLSKWKRDPEFKEEFQRSLRDSINLSSAIAYQTIMKLMNARSELVRLQAAKDILDRAGFAEPEQQKDESTESEIAKMLRNLAGGKDGR